MSEICCTFAVRKEKNKFNLKVVATLTNSAITTMGQYYKPTFKAKNSKTWQNINSWSVDCGAKLMEHSYFGTRFVNIVESLFHHNKMQLVWAGDYAANEIGENDNLYYLGKELSDKIVKHLLTTWQFRVDTSHDLESEEKKWCIVFNHTRNEYIDLRRYMSPKAEDWYKYPHPLPILTCEGNGGGGGDYYGETNRHLVGTWARNIIEIMQPSDLQVIMALKRKNHKKLPKEICAEFKEY